MRIYLSGAITGTKDYAEKFDRAQDAVRDLFPDAEVINPAAVMAPIENHAEFTHTDFMDVSFLLLGKCDVIWMIPGWERSRGANREFGFAVARDMTILNLDGDLEEVAEKGAGE